MSNVINKSTHPVEIKKISLSVWTLRSEIETAIAERLKEDPENHDIEDIKKYYIDILNRDLSSESDDDEDDDMDERQDDNLDSSGNPMDEDAAAMMAALAGGDADEEESETEESEDSEEEVAAESEAEGEEEGEGEEEDEAARLAAEMLAGQGGDTTETESSAEEAESADKAVTPATKQTKKFTRPIPEQTTDAFLMLSDINMAEIMIFAKGTFVHGQNIIIQFNIPNSFKQLATVIKAVDISRNSKVISTAKPSHRLHLCFEFKFPGDRDALRNFLKSIEPTIPAPPKKMKRPETEDEDDDFDDLGF